VTFVGVGALLVCAYLLGSINAALVVARARSVDIRAVGSGNPGASNVLRAMGKGPATVVYLADLLKGWLPAVVGLAVWDATIAGMVGLGAVIGHCYPAFHRLRGGKGVATLAGMMAVLNPVLLAMGLATWLLGYALYRRVSAASIAVAAALPLYAWAVHRGWDLVLAGLLLGTVVVYRHQENLRRLLRGEEDWL